MSAIVSIVPVAAAISESNSHSCPLRPTSRDNTKWFVGQRQSMSVVAVGLSASNQNTEEEQIFRKTSNTAPKSEIVAFSHS